MWFLIGEGVKTRPVAGGRSARGRCEACAAERGFHEARVESGADPELTAGVDIMVCDVCGSAHATDEVDVEFEHPQGAGAQDPGGALHDPETIAGTVETQGGTALARSGGGGLGTSGAPRGGLLGRIGNLFRGRVAGHIERAIDPAKEVEQLILDMEEQLRAARGETMRMMATRKRAAQRVATLGQESALWTERAEQAVRAGDDALAKQALERKIDTDGRIVEARREAEEAAAFAEQSQATLKGLDAKLKQVKLRKGTIKAKLSSRRSSELRADSFENFDRMAERVDDQEVALDAEAELAREGIGASRVADRDAEVAEKFNALSRKGGVAGSSELDDRLAALKRKMEK